MKQSSCYLLVYKPVKIAQSLFGYKMQVMNESCKVVVNWGNETNS